MFRNKNAKKLDFFLREKTENKHNLWHFSFSLFWDCFLFPLRDLRGSAKEIAFMKMQKRCLEKLWDETMGRYPNQPSCIYFILKDIKAAIEKYSKVLGSQSLRGAPVARMNVIALTWARFLPGNYEIHGLLEWFSKRFECLPEYKAFCDEVKAMSADKLRKLLYAHKQNDFYRGLIEQYKRAFVCPGGSVAISFETFGSKRLEEPVAKSTPLLSFPDGNILTVGDFEENDKKAKVLYKATIKISC